MHDAPTHAARWTTRTLLLIAAVLAARFVCIALVPLDLVPDEAYYWDWSRSLDWCYYSKPPMVAWLIALSTRTLGTTAWAIRLPAALCSVAAIAAVFALCRAMFSARTGFFAALAFALAPSTFLLGMIMTIDPPLVCCWSVALWCLWNALVAQRLRGTWWLAAGVAVAFGMLAKQMMVVFPLLAVVFLLTSGRHRGEFSRPWVYLFVLLALCGLAPILWWNSQHGWLIVQHSSKHFTPNQHTFDFIGTFFFFIGTQACVISPLLWPLMIAAGVVCLARFRRQPDTVRFLLLFSVVPLLGFAAMSLRQHILPNWPAVYYLAGCVFCAAWACGDVSAGTLVDRARRLFVPGLWIGGGVTAIACLLVSLAGATGMFEKQLSKQLSGWKTLGGKVEDAYRMQPGTNTLMLMAKDRELAAELGFYMPSQPRVVEWPLDIVIYSQYHLWQRGFDKTNGTWDALLVWEPQKPVKCLPVETGWFTRVDYLCAVTSGARRVDLYRCHNLSRWRAPEYHLPKKPKAIMAITNGTLTVSLPAYAPASVVLDRYLLRK